jgi:hypothetical protein
VGGDPIGRVGQPKGPCLRLSHEAHAAHIRGGPPHRPLL